MMMMVKVTHITVDLPCLRVFLDEDIPKFLPQDDSPNVVKYRNLLNRKQSRKFVSKVPVLRVKRLESTNKGMRSTQVVNFNVTLHDKFMTCNSVVN